MEYSKLMKMVPCVFLGLFLLGNTGVVFAATPLYKPSARSLQPIDITTNAYGFSANAPKALELGEYAPDFRVRGQKGIVNLAAMRHDGPVVIVFYRGHW